MHAQLVQLINQLRAGNFLRADGAERVHFVEPRYSGQEIADHFNVAQAVFRSTYPHWGHAAGFGRTDADESIFLARQLLYVQAKEVYQQFTPLKATKLIPVDGSIPSGAEAYSTPIYTQVGTAAWVTNYGNGFPMVEVRGQENINPVRSIGVGYAYTVQDLRRAAMAGQQPLDQRRASVARMVHDRFVEEAAAFGDSTIGVPGFLTNSAVTVINKSSTPAITGGWETATGAQIYADLQLIASQIPTNSKGVFTGDTLVLPLAAYTIASRTPFSTLIADSVLDVFLRTNPWVKNCDFWAPCDNNVSTDGTISHPISNSTKTRAACYQRDPMVVDMKIPQAFEQFAPQLVNLQFNIPCHSRHGGCPVYYPLGMLYIDDLVSVPST